MSSGTKYHANEHQMHSLNVIVGQKGSVSPSEVSNALAAYQVADAANDQAAMDKAFNDAGQANKRQRHGRCAGLARQIHTTTQHQAPATYLEFRVYDWAPDILDYIVATTQPSPTRYPTH